MNFDSQRYRYPSKRHVVYGTNGMVATSQPLAAQAGLDIIKMGGNAVDAAVAAAACLTVVEPVSNGIGSDCFALVWVKGNLYGLNGSGFAPYHISAEKIMGLGHNEIPRHGFVPVTVPGTPAAWYALSQRFGVLPFGDLLKPAIDIAERGYPVTPGVSGFWNAAYNIYNCYRGKKEFEPWFEVFAPKGRAPRTGEVWKSKNHADTLRLIAKTDAKDFYYGSLADAIDSFSKQNGGFIRKHDLMRYKPEWVEPIGIDYRGYRIWEIPPNGQGLVALLALNILSGFEFLDKESVYTYHRQLEAIKLAFADGHKYITDIRDMKVSVQSLLSDEYAAKRRSIIQDTAIMPKAGRPDSGGTVYLAAADGDGNMVSFIQSNYMGFGSGIVIPNTGIALQNRGHNFSLDPNHYNYIMPGKKTYHTIIPGFITRDGGVAGAFGVMGGFMQPQGHVQVIMNLIDFGLNPQEALDAPRWQWMEGNSVNVESIFPPDTARALSRMGHKINVDLLESSFGRGQIILRNNDGVLAGGTEGRTDGYIAVY